VFWVDQYFDKIVYKQGPNQLFNVIMDSWYYRLNFYPIYSTKIRIKRELYTLKKKSYPNLDIENEMILLKVLIMALI